MRIFFVRINQFLDFVRYWEWTDKLQLNIIAVLILYIFSEITIIYFFVLIFYILYLVIAFIFGYCLNTLADYKDDALVGKVRSDQFSSTTLLATTVFSGMATFIIPVVTFNPFIISVLLIQVILTLFYSLEPIRLKERGFLGILTAGITQRLPFLFIIILLPVSPSLGLYLFGWLILVGILIELAHQYQDYDHDVKTHTNTFVTQLGRTQTFTLLIYGTITILFYFLIPLFFPFNNSLLLILLLLIFSTQALYFLRETLSFYK